MRMRSLPKNVHCSFFLYSLVFRNCIYRSLSICPIILWTVGVPHDVTTNLRHSSLSSAFLTVSLSPKPVHSQMLSSHRFLCLSLLLPPCTVPWRNVLARPEDLVMCHTRSIYCDSLVKRFCYLAVTEQVKFGTPSLLSRSFYLYLPPLPLSVL